LPQSRPCARAPGRCDCAPPANRLNVPASSDLLAGRSGSLNGVPLRATEAGLPARSETKGYGLIAARGGGRRRIGRAAAAGQAGRGPIRLGRQGHRHPHRRGEAQSGPAHHGVTHTAGSHRCNHRCDRRYGCRAHRIRNGADPNGHPPYSRRRPRRARGQYCAPLTPATGCAAARRGRR